MSFILTGLKATGLHATRPNRMAEALGVASGIAGLITLTSEVVRAIQHYPPRCTNDMLQKLSVLEETLCRLDTMYRKGERVLADGTSVLLQAVAKCTAQLEELRQRIVTSSRKRSRSVLSARLEDLKWPFQATIQEELLSNIHGYVQIFNLALNAQGW